MSQIEFSLDISKINEFVLEVQTRIEEELGIQLQAEFDFTVNTQLDYEVER